MWSFDTDLLISKKFSWRPPSKSLIRKQPGSQSFSVRLKTLNYMQAFWPAWTVVAYSYLEQFSYSGTCSTNAKSLIELPFLGPNMLASHEPHYSFFSGILAIFILYLKLTVFFFFFLLIRRSCYRFCFWACLFIRAILTSSSSFSSASGSQLSK